MNENIMYMREEPGSGLLIYKTPESLRIHSARYYKDWIYCRYHEGDLHVFSVGNEESTPDKSIIDRVLPYRFMLHYVVGGSGIYCGQRIGPGDGFICWPKEKHTIISDPNDPMHFYWMDFYGDTAYNFMHQNGFDTSDQFFTFDWQDRLQRFLNDLIYGDNHNMDISDLMEAYLHILMSYHKYKNSVIVEHDLNTRQRHVENAAHYIVKNVSDVHAESVAKRYNLSPKYLNKLFVQYKGSSVQSFIIHTRMNCAADMLQSREYSIKNIALKVGYTDYAQFSKIFKKYKGVSPQAYRARTENYSQKKS